VPNVLQRQNNVSALIEPEIGKRFCRQHLQRGAFSGRDDNVLRPIVAQNGMDRFDIFFRPIPITTDGEISQFQRSYVLRLEQCAAWADQPRYRTSDEPRSPNVTVSRRVSSASRKSGSRDQVGARRETHHTTREIEQNMSSEPALRFAAVTSDRIRKAHHNAGLPPHRLP
jgi:hypothetical protein